MAAKRQTINEAALRQIVETSVRNYLMESGMDEGWFKNFTNGVKGVAKGVGNAVGNAVDNAKMNAYQAQMQGIETDNQAIDHQIEQLQASKKQQMQAAANAKAQEIDQQIQQLQAKKGNANNFQDKWNAAAQRINNRQATGYINNRQYAPQDARNPQQGYQNYK